ncbi:MAG: bifunctional (p)ppGpp synthetase/guanosine-3',5'-bis(diphosphate) 3'-pyrophosphohydrolase [Rhodospirillaceae bacterium]|nr:bifunctional (p)ppGpp synthetase/guanosine-3',5'-bis(diphosphate) 3'-pyrophosphohydrolase [Rhodospirillaceae bacterium]MCA8933307.1 bifunctional (p)ppGpp synthetase/guanosine-3',5'-bis(diphosphate) 3'-pyrophosphohydrolase [Rhodospirillaceae bacterium]
MIRQYELVERVKAYNPDADEGLINRAYVYSLKAHGSQVRASGDPYFTHPLEVAGLLADMRLDTGSIVTGLLHDTVEDTVATLEDIRGQFGEEIAQLVDGVTKLSQLELQSDRAKQAENFRKLVLAMSRDLRVLLVKLCDRLHNMRTLDAIQKPESRQRIARETLEIYAPLAERIGMHQVKDELEDLAFQHLFPEARASIVQRLVYLRDEGGDIVDRIIAELTDILNQGGVEAQIRGRQKRPYSIWRKMQQKDVAFENLSDIMAFRVIVPDLATCYQTLGLLHHRYKSLPGRFKDYISTPKPNGYKSLHTALIGPFLQVIEVQIRTHDMHEVAELGVAAHWSYKQGMPQPADMPKYRWLRELLDILEYAQKPEEFLEHTKLELFQDQVFCFTPKGQLIALPQGATPVDFAYAVHSEVGDRCVGAKVNGRIVNLRTSLHNGDQVEIITSKTQKPSPEWERFVVSGKARARIRRFIRQQQRDQYAELGKAMLQKVYRQEGYEFVEKPLDAVAGNFKVPSVEDLYAGIGAGNIPARDVFFAVYPGHKQAAQQRQDNVVPLTRSRRPGAERDPAVAIRGLIPGISVHFARCCHPIPGDRIVGIVTTGKGVTIHTIDCETLESFYDTPERWLDVSWDADVVEEDSHTARIHVVLANEPGSLGTLSTVIGKSGGNITNIKVIARSTDFFDLLLDISVTDVRHLSNIIAALRATPVISTVDRARTG